MPVVKIDLERFVKMVGAPRRQVLDRLPYLGLDIEGEDQASVRVEFSPNRPDFGTDYGIAMALRGLLGLQTGPPSYQLRPSGLTVDVDPRLESVRPRIACAVAGGLHLDEEDLRQLISLQEDLHNGIGRGRRKLAIGLHALEAVTGPVHYRAEGGDFSFVPLGSGREMTLSEILAETDQGRQYSRALPGKEVFPILLDSRGVVLSFPPIINGEATRVTTRTRGLFIDVTGTDARAVDDALAILAATLAEAGGRLGSVTVAARGKARTTPDLRESSLPLYPGLVEEVLGLRLGRKDIVTCLRRSRLGVSGRRVIVPRYRIDMMHPVDVAEEVALGYGFDRIQPVYPPSGQPGSFNRFEGFLDRVVDAMVASGMTELMTYELLDERTQFANFGREVSAVSVENPRSSEHSILRDSLVPSLLSALSRNLKEEYPQRVFEVGRCYRIVASEVYEGWNLAALSAHGQASFSEAKAYLDSFFRTLFGRTPRTTAASHWAFSEGRVAAAHFSGRRLGFVGEVKPEALGAFGVRVPVVGFELDLTALSKQLK